MSIWLGIYVVVMIYIILGCPTVLPDLGRWLHEGAKDNISGWVLTREIIKALIIWPWFDIKKVQKKYST